jgi:hypothetical protein
MLFTKNEGTTFSISRTQHEIGGGGGRNGITTLNIKQKWSGGAIGLKKER